MKTNNAFPDGSAVVGASGLGRAYHGHEPTRLGRGARQGPVQLGGIAAWPNSLSRVFALSSSPSPSSLCVR